MHCEDAEVVRVIRQREIRPGDIHGKHAAHGELLVAREHVAGGQAEVARHVARAQCEGVDVVNHCVLSRNNSERRKVVITVKVDVSARGQRRHPPDDHDACIVDGAARTDVEGPGNHGIPEDDIVQLHDFDIIDVVERHRSEVVARVVEAHVGAAGIEGRGADDVRSAVLSDRAGGRDR